MSTSAQKPLVQISNVSATQVVNTQRVALGTGLLSISLPPPQSPSPPLDNSSSALDVPTLLLKVGTQLTFPLYERTTVVGTSVGSSRTYLFTIDIDIAAAAADDDDDETSNVASSNTNKTGFIELLLPKEVDDEKAFPEAATAATTFEAILAQHGFLKTGLVADADDFSRVLQETAGSAAAKLNRRTENKLGRRSPVEEDVQRKFSNTTHKVVEGTVEGTGKVREVAGKISGALSMVAYDSGAWFGEKIGVSRSADQDGMKKEKSLPREAVENGIGAAEMALEGTGKSAGHITSTIGTSASRIAQNEKGEEAKTLVDGGRQVAGNVGTVALDTLTGASVLWHAGEAGVGAAKGRQMDTESGAKGMHGEDFKVIEKN